MGDLEAMAKALDTPEMRKLYKRQKIADPNLDQTVEELFKDIEEIFGHGIDSQRKK